MCKASHQLYASVNIIKKEPIYTDVCIRTGVLKRKKLLICSNENTNIILLVQK